MSILMADLVAQQQMWEDPGQYITEKAKQLLAKILLPEQITGKLIEKYIRKAIRLGAWRKLPLEARIFLQLVKKISRIKSTFMIQLLEKIIIIIELQGIKGRALFYGLIISLKKQESFLKELKNNISKILALGIFYLNHPLNEKIE